MPPVVRVPIVRPVIGVPIVAMMTDTVVSSVTRRPHEQNQHQAAKKPSGSSHGVDSSVKCEVHARRQQECTAARNAVMCQTSRAGGRLGEDWVFFISNYDDLPSATEISDARDVNYATLSPAIVDRFESSRAEASGCASLRFDCVEEWRR